jgi:hypothetical protein
MSKKIIGVALGLAAFAAAPFIASTAVAQISTPTEAQQNEQLIQKLRDAREVAEDNANSWTQEPITSREFADQESQLNGLIQRLKRGEKVSPSEIDEALKSPETPY